jgi:recombination protein RecT
MAASIAVANTKAQSQAVAAPQKSVRQQIDELRPEFAKTLPVNITPDAFIRNVHTAIQLQPDLLECTPRSLFASCMKAANDGLILDGREAALIVRNVKVSKNPDRWEKQATYQPMVQGLMKLARNSGEISSITAQVVYKNDKFLYALGDNERIEHEPAPIDQDQGDPIAVYAIVKLKDGTVIREVMRAKAVLAIGAQGSNGYQYQPSSGKNFAEWWRKTAIRRITKYIPRSSDAIGKFASAAEQIDQDYDFDAEPVQPAQPAGKRRGAAAEALRDITPTQPEADSQGEVIDADYTGDEFPGDVQYTQQEDDDI